MGSTDKPSFSAPFFVFLKLRVVLENVQRKIFIVCHHFCNKQGFFPASTGRNELWWVVINIIHFLVHAAVVLLLSNDLPSVDLLI